MTVKGRCHCGAVQFEIDAAPAWVRECSCSLCARLGVLWGYYPDDQVRIEAAAGATIAYVQGDRTLEAHHCATCGCTTHWRSIVPEYPGRMAVNARLIDGGLPAGTAIVPVDGARF